MGATLHRGVRASHYRGLSCCGAQAPDAQAQQLWFTGPVAPRHVGSSQTRARTRVPCIGRQILNHCATREASLTAFLKPSESSCETQNKTPAFVVACEVSCGSFPPVTLPPPPILSHIGLSLVCASEDIPQDLGACCAPHSRCFSMFTATPPPSLRA